MDQNSNVNLKVSSLVNKQVALLPSMCGAKTAKVAPHLEGSNADFVLHMEGSHADFALHMEESHADFALHMEGSHADFAPHMERRLGSRDQQIAKIAFSAKNFKEFVQTTYIQGVYIASVTIYENKDILREGTFNSES
jgi:hypothetical protein